MVIDPFGVKEVARVEVRVEDYTAEGESLMGEGDGIIFIIFDRHINKITIRNKIGDLHRNIVS